MKKIVLIIGPNYFNYLSAVAVAFERAEWDTVVEAYDNPIHPYTRAMKWRYKLSRNKKTLQDKSRLDFNEYISRQFDVIKPSLVFVLNGDILFGSTLDTFRRAAYVGLWFFDNRKRLPTALEHINHVDALFCYEQEDVEWYAAQGKKAFFLPQACDTSTYHPLGLEKDIDILFVGNLYSSPKRMQIMQAVVRAFPKQKIKVYGLYKPWYKGFFRCLFRERRDVYMNRIVAPDKVNELYNRSRVVLNIHQEEQKAGANPRTFEILGSGAWQVCDANSYIEKLFSSDEIGIFHSQEELLSLIREGLREDKTSSVSKARAKVLAEHTFEVRIKEVLNTLGTIRRE